MTDAIVVILSGNKATVYLYGSVALDDFKLAWSDIDILGFQRSQNYWRKQYGAYHPHSRRIRQGQLLRTPLHGRKLTALFAGN